jgi:hypothetical protein
MTNQPDRDRRLVLGAVATGGSAETPVLAHSQKVQTMAKPLVDPTSAYPKPPLPKQQQPWPGLTNKMDPRPDHGEASYKGSGRLAGRKALLTGGDSGICRAAAITYAREGADMAINYPAAEEPDARRWPADTRRRPQGGAAPRRHQGRGLLPEARGRPGRPTVLLASPESSYSTGQVFAAVGGRGGP